MLITCLKSQLSVEIFCKSLWKPFIAIFLPPKSSINIMKKWVESSHQPEFVYFFSSNLVKHERLHPMVPLKVNSFFFVKGISSMHAIILKRKKILVRRKSEVNKLGTLKMQWHSKDFFSSRFFFSFTFRDFSLLMIKCMHSTNAAAYCNPIVLIFTPSSECNPLLSFRCLSLKRLSKLWSCNHKFIKELYRWMLKKER